jgi:hypothetical protein
MADRSRILKLNILAETKDLVKGLDKANQEVSGAGEKIGAAFKKVAVIAAAAAAAVGAFAIKLGKDSIQAAIQAESQQNRLRQILLATGAATEAQIKQLDRQANALEKVGVVSAGNIKVAQSQLATFDLQATTIKTLTPAILDYVTAEKGATASAEDFKSMTNGLAQALQGNFASLTRTGFVLDENTKNLIKNGTETERAAALVEVLNSTYKGFNETLAQTTEGRLQQLRNNFERIKETIGAVLLPVFNEMVKFIAERILPIIDNLVARFEKDANPTLNKMKEVIVGFVLPALTNLWLFIRDYIIPTLRNLLQPAINIIVIGFNFLVGIIKDNQAGFQVFLGVIERVWSFIKNQLAPIIGTALATAFNILFRIVGDLINAFLKFFEIIGKVASLIGIDLRFNLDRATTSTNNLNSGIVDAYKNFGSQSKGIKEEVIPALKGLTSASESVTDAQTKKTEATKKATSALKEQKKEAAELAKILGLTAATDYAQLQRDPTGALAVAAARAARAARAAAASGLSAFELKQLEQGEGLSIADILKLTTAKGATGQTFAYGDQILSGAAVNELISRGLGGLTPGQLQASASGMGQYTALTVNVNGTVLDAEGVARAIQDVIQQSNARSGTQSFTPAFGVE